MNQLRPPRPFSAAILALALIGPASAQTTDDTAQANPRSTTESGKGSPSGTATGAPAERNFEVPPNSGDRMQSDKPDAHTNYGWLIGGAVGLAALAGLVWWGRSRPHRPDRADPRTA